MKPATMKSCVLAAMLIFAAPLPALADSVSEATAAVWDRHLAAGTAGDLDALVADFSEDAAVVTPAGIIRGKDNIRGYFEELLGAFPPGAEDSVVVNTLQVHRDFVLFNFTVTDVGETFNDTAIIRDGKIVVFSTVGYPAASPAAQ